MRLRTIVLVVGVLGITGSILWSYGTDNGKTAAVGAGGLPLIKAEANPAKIPPEEGTESEIIPNADSTVFAAMGTEDAQDPSMENIAPPATEDKSSTDFAGFRTGFALPKEAPRKKESLFEEPEKQEPEAESKTETDSATSQYFSGLAPDAVSATDEAPPPAEPVVTASTEQGPAPEPASETQPTPAPETTPPVATTEPEGKPESVPEPQEPAAPEALSVPEDNISAQALEAQEKILVRPASKPLLVDKKTEAKKQDPTPVKKEEPFDALKVAEKASEPAKTQPADDVYPIKPVTPKADAQTPQGTYYIQLSSAPKGSDVEGTWRGLQGRYGQALAGLSPSFPEAEIAGKGTFVRIQAGPMSREEANKRCAALRAANPNGGCLVIRK